MSTIQVSSHFLGFTPIAHRCGSYLALVSSPEALTMLKEVFQLAQASCSLSFPFGWLPDPLKEGHSQRWID